MLYYYIYGELSEWSKVQHSKCCVRKYLGFESLTLRQCGFDRRQKPQKFSLRLFAYSKFSKRSDDMFFSEDWIIRQIEMLIAALIDAIFEHKPSEKPYTSEQITVNDLVDKNKICEAENFLFETAKLKGTESNREFLVTVLDFYQRINSMSEEELNAAGFSHDEIKQGLLDFFSKYCDDEKVGKIIENAYLDEIIATNTESEESEDISI